MPFSKNKTTLTHEYFRNSSFHFAYVERQMSEFKDRLLWIRSLVMSSSNLVLACIIYSEAVKARICMTVNPPLPRFKLCYFRIKLPVCSSDIPACCPACADSRWIIILKTFELVTFSFSQFHAQGNGPLTHDCYAVFEAWCKKKCREFFFHCLFC